MSQSRLQAIRNLLAFVENMDDCWADSGGWQSGEFREQINLAKAEADVLERELAEIQNDPALLEALGRHVEFQVYEHSFPCFNMIDAQRRREIAMPLRVELGHFLKACYGEDVK